MTAALFQRFWFILEKRIKKIYPTGWQTIKFPCGSFEEDEVDVILSSEYRIRLHLGNDWSKTTGPYISTRISVQFSYWHWEFDVNEMSLSFFSHNLLRSDSLVVRCFAWNTEACDWMIVVAMLLCKHTGVSSTPHPPPPHCQQTQNHSYHTIAILTPEPPEPLKPPQKIFFF